MITRKLYIYWKNKIRVIFLLAMITGLGQLLYAQNMKEIAELRKLSAQTHGAIEGYSKSFNQSGFTYPSVQLGMEKAMIAFASGEKIIEWNTMPIPANYDKDKGAKFLFLVDIVKSGKYKFDFYVDGAKKFSFSNLNKSSWSDTTSDGGVLSFYMLEMDAYGVAMGYMTLYAPSSWIHPGRAAHLKIVGDPGYGGAGWIRLFESTNALAYLNAKANYENLFYLYSNYDGKEAMFRLEVPPWYVGEVFNFKFGKTIRSAKGELQDSVAIFKVKVDRDKIRKDGQLPLLQVSKGQDLLMVSDTLFKPNSPAYALTENGLIIREGRALEPDGWLQIIRRKFIPSLSSNLKLLSGISVSPPPLYLLSSSHQDIAWMDTPEKCELFRDTMVITPLLALMEQDSSYHFDIENVLMIKEYLHRHPDRTGMIKHFLENGQLNVGGSFNCTYEDMYSGESLVRGFYQGAKWINENLDYSPITYWNVDVPGRTMQMPQILKKSGIKMMVISRMAKGLFNWMAPDGSKVVTYSPKNYWDMIFAFQLWKDEFSGLNYMAEFAGDFKKQTQDKKISNTLIQFLWDKDMNPPGGTNQILNKWDAFTGRVSDSSSGKILKLPKILYATSSDIYNYLGDNKESLPTIRGERPNTWVYISGPSHERALHASRDGDILLPAAEQFSAINSLLEGNFNRYPAAELKQAWEAKIYPDHGWGGKNGQITDNFFLQKFLFAKEKGKEILNNALRQISGRIKFQKALGKPVVIFNSLSWNRNAPVNTELHFTKGEAYKISIIDKKGSPIPYQLTDESYYEDNSLKSVKVSFIAIDVPSIGYDTYYVKPLKSSTHNETDKSSISDNQEFESDYYRIKLGNGGLASIYDKALGKELLNTDKFLGGEIFTMRSKGTGAIAETDIQQPDMRDFDKTSLHPNLWKIVADGPVYTALRFRTSIKYADAQLTVLLYKHLKRIDFKVDILNWQGVLYREFRMALPLKMNESKIAYAVPFGILRVGEDEIHGFAGGDYTTTDNRLIHPRSIQSWIGAYNNEGSVTLSSDVAVADYIDPTTNPVSYSVLQPILFASRKSIHGLGNEYLQTGDHHFTFSFTSSGTSDLVAQNMQGIGNHVPLFSVANPLSCSASSLYDRYSFLNTDNQNILITALKKAEDEDKITVRFYNASGKEQEVKLNFFRRPTNTMKTNIIEEVLQPLQSQDESNAIKLEVGKYSIETLNTNLIR